MTATDETPSPRVGDRVRIVSLPDVSNLAVSTRVAFRLALGKVFTVEAIGEYGHLELLLGPEADQRLGGFMSSIWIEPEHTVLVEG